MGQLRLLGEPPASDDHAALANLAFPEAGHTGFVAGAGLTSGQTIIGGVAGGESLTLQSTAHAARGYVRLQDDLQLLSNVIRDSAANERIRFATVLPHITLGGNTRIAGTLGVGVDPLTHRMVQAEGAIAPGILGCAAVGAQITSSHIGGARNAVGLIGAAYGAPTGNGTSSGIFGLYFLAAQASANAAATLGGIYVYIQSTPAGTGPITIARGIQMPLAAWAGAKPATSYGIDIADQGGSGVGTAYGLAISDQTATTVRLLELGPATPYLRLAGGAQPGGNQTNLYLNEGGNLRRVQWKLYSSLIAGDRVMVLV
jgi:hypothetical protein